MDAEWDRIAGVCRICRAPVPDGGDAIGSIFIRHRTHDSWTCIYGDRACVRAWIDGDTATIQRRRAQACAAGHHHYPGTWTPDPTDPTGRASFWICKHGCGHRQHHLGYQ